MIKIASTVAKIGRSMKNEEMFIAIRLSVARGRGVRLGCAHGHPLRCDRDPGMHALRAVHHDDVAGFQPFAHDAQAVDHAAELRLLRYSILLSAPSTQHVLLILVGVDGAVVDQDGRSTRRCRAVARARTCRA